MKGVKRIKIIFELRTNLILNIKNNNIVTLFFFLFQGLIFVYQKLWIILVEGSGIVPVVICSW